MSPANQYKKVENKLVEQIDTGTRRVGRGITDLGRRFYNAGRQRFTVMFIPHSEKKVFNFRISVFSLVFFCFILTGILTVFFIFSTRYSGLSRMLQAKSGSLDTTEANLELILDEIASLRKVSAEFETTLNKTMNTLKLTPDEASRFGRNDGDLISFFGVEEQDGIMMELSELRSLSSYLSESVHSLEKIAGLLDSHSDLLVELPTFWPVEGGDGRITQYFGPADHPFTHNWYLHMGMDIAYGYGKPILAAANGKVIERKYDSLGFGNYIVIRHKYGFQTKYGHLQDVYVYEGDEVTQGQKIGTMGSTGLSTGPHLHFEVRIGSQVVDPERFLSVRKSSS
ncbi:MAG: peptidoglycan DD-metalloendopeptidase family protein [Spirochaetales bacterium]|nr:peptidoglycan DD-metalloendopeptidase family protein [Spirochaetales bacterium]